MVRSSQTRPASAQNLGEGAPEQLLCAGPVFGLHKDAAYEVPCLLGGVRGQRRVGGLGGDLEYGRHGLEFSPRGLFRQHLYHRTTEAPVKETHHLLESAVESHDMLKRIAGVNGSVYRLVLSGKLRRAACTRLRGTSPPGSITPPPTWAENLEHANLCYDLSAWP